IFTALQQIRTPMVIDGEIVALDKEGRSGFQLLQEYEENPDIPLRYYVFDILEHNGKDVTGLPLLERKALLKKILPEGDVIRYCHHVEADGLKFFNDVRKKNLEGMLAKRKDSPYLPGKRTSLWLKVKNQHTEEVVIVGFTAPRGSRKRFGALVLGIYKKGKLVYAGHTGTGFTDQLLDDLYDKMLPLIHGQSPFDTEIKTANGVTWLRPKLVANVRFTEWTKDGIMRHPVFQGLRIDKTVEELK
ncbi:MAG TPA: non-homologous end-joining DNA ligase, partial [Puia sp.]|nr:non-homologous end-joining DNA ligase [Puia sp.]